MTASTERATGEIDAYSAGFPAEAQEKLQKVRLAIRAAAPEVVPGHNKMSTMALP